MSDLISIIIPVYNAEKFLDDTLRCIFAQDYENWELLLVDDCSKDGSIEKIENIMNAYPQYRDRVRLISQNTNSGAATARNQGIYLARGRFIAFQDADDLWHPKKLSKMYAFMQEMNAAFAYHGYEFAQEDGHGTGRIVHVLPLLDYDHALTRTIVATITVVFDMSKLTKEEILFPQCPSEDTALWWRLLRSGYIAYGLDESLALYRRSQNTLSSNKFVAVERIWYLYRKREELPILKAGVCLLGWAIRATLRRI